MKRIYWILLTICVLAIIPRIFSVQWNIIPHSDIGGDAIAAASFVETQQLIASLEPDLRTPHFYPPGTNKNLLVAHPPLWPLLGSSVITLLALEPTQENAYFALQILSVLSGIGVIVLSAFLARKLWHNSAALMIALWLSLSYIMIDFSGNGAMYSLQAITYLVWILLAYSSLKPKAVWFGIINGIAYLVNHQSMILSIGSVILLALDSTTPWKIRCRNIAIVTIVTFVVASPWLIRNYLLYGDLFFSHAVNSTYIYTKAGIPYEDIDGRIYYILGIPERLSLFRHVFTLWIPYNMYYVARKLFILAPIIFFFFSFAWIDYLFSWKRIRPMLPILTVFVLHLLLSTAWPITKFRYFVPMMPLVFFIGLDQIYNLHLRERLRYAILSMTTVSILGLSYLTYQSIPTHTYYFDGAITNDPFKNRGEYNYMKDNGFIHEEE